MFVHNAGNENVCGDQLFVRNICNKKIKKLGGGGGGGGMGEWGGGGGGGRDM